MPDQVFSGRTALVTGSSQGIGCAVATTLGVRGTSVTLNYPLEQDAANAQAAVRRIQDAGGQATAIQADISKLADIARLFDEAEAAFGPLDFVVNNVGRGGVRTPIADTTEAQFDEVMGLNAKACFFVLQQAARRVRDNGRIIAVSSSITSVPAAGLAPYAGSKAAVELFCKVLAKEVGHRGITVNAVSPGMTKTEGLLAHGPRPERVEMMKGLTPLGRLADAQDVADVIVMLLGQDAHWITAQNIKAGGGAFS